MKKIFSLCLIIIMLSCTVFADDTAAVQTHIDDLNRLGIMVGDEDGNLRLGDKITRAEAAKMMCVTAGLSIDGIDGENVFPDVSKSHWAYKYISALKKAEIISGDENGNFNPEDNITNEEIIKIIVGILGYSPMAEARGGYPAGFNTVASQHGITEGFSFETNTPAIREDVALIIYRALDTPIMAAVQKPDAVEYKILDGTKGLPKMTLRNGVTNWDTSRSNIVRYAQDFASQYEYKEGDEEKSFTLYPDIVYTSGVDKTPDGKEFEWPAFYDDEMAQNLVNSMEAGIASIDGTEYKTEYLVFADKILVPAESIKLPGVSVGVNPALYVATIQNDETVLEILPNLIGMRKNQAEGYWVPLEVCARIYKDRFYVPLDAVLYEFGFKCEFDSDSKIISIK